jgi:lipopolysaccharide biosynthesis glycosyltransferase
MLCSLLEHNRVSHIHLFHNTAAIGELPKLKSFVAKYGSEISFYEIAPERLQSLRVDGHVSAAAYYRLMSALILPANIEKILYLDSDIIVRHSLSELWEIDLKDQALAAVDDLWPTTEAFVAHMEILGLPSNTRYFNSGVMLINLNYWRQNNVCERATAFVRENPEKVEFHDQDALNVILVGRWIHLPGTWNGQDFGGTGRPVPDVAIVHFIGPGKPWHWSWRSNEHPFKKEYRQYRRKTPWRQYTLEGRLTFC